MHSCLDCIAEPAADKEYNAAQDIKVKGKRKRLSEQLFYDRWQQYKPTLYWMVKDLLQKKEAAAQRWKLQKDDPLKHWKSLGFAPDCKWERGAPPLVNGYAQSKIERTKSRTSAHQVLIICVLGGPPSARPLSPRPPPSCLSTLCLLLVFLCSSPLPFYLCLSTLCPHLSPPGPTSLSKTRCCALHLIWSSRSSI